MPRVLTAYVSAAAADDVTRFVTCWTVVKVDGTVLGFTSHVQDLVVSAVTYEAATGYTPSSVDSSNRFNVDNLEVEGIVTGPEITVEAITAGEFDASTVTMFLVDFRNPDAGRITLRTGTLGEIIRRDNDFTAEVRGLLQRLQQTTTEIYAPACHASLGDARCMVPVSAPYWSSSVATSAYVSGAAGDGTNSFVRSATLTSRLFKATTDGTTGTTEPAFSSTVGATVADGSVTWETMYGWQVSATVSTVTDRANFIVEGRDEPNDHWKIGKCEFKTGDNAGRSMDIKANVSAGVIELYLPMTSNITAGDTVVLTAGCGKRNVEDCRGRFNNLVNFRGHPFIPGRDAVIGGEKK